MSKKHSIQTPQRRREAVPKLQKDAHGANILLCPFCPDPHPVMPFVPSQCGTVIEFFAVQTIYRARFDKRFVCAKCGEGGGEMVRWNDAFLHVPDCKPEVRTLLAPPKYSKFAGAVYKLPDKVKGIIEKITGRAVPVEEVMPDGKLTGTVLGYFFQKKKKVKNA